MGKKKAPYYRIIVADGRAPRDGRFIEAIGTYDPNQEPSAVKIDKEACDPEDVEMLEEMIMAAANEALRKMDELSQERMAKVTGGLGGASGLF